MSKTYMFTSVNFMSVRGGFSTPITFSLVMNLSPQWAHTCQLWGTFFPTSMCYAPHFSQKITCSGPESSWASTRNSVVTLLRVVTVLPSASTTSFGGATCYLSPKYRTISGDIKFWLAPVSIRAATSLPCNYKVIYWQLLPVELEEFISSTPELSSWATLDGTGWSYCPPPGFLTTSPLPPFLHMPSTWVWPDT